ncbi:MAG TPA: VIT domain-containing protein [bacterium]|nr:VIT domain-containing protein [bacterium]
MKILKPAEGPEPGRHPRNRAAFFLGAAMLIVFIILSAGAGAEIGAFKVVEWQEGNVPKGAISLRDLEIEVTIDGGFAQTRVRQVFENHYEQAVMGSYYLKLPADASLMDFGVWDDGRWTDAVVIERERGKRAFTDIVERMIDPALLEAPEAEMTDAFQVRVAPIPGYGTRRVEAAFHAWVPVRSAKRGFVLPTKSGPELAADKAGHCRITIKATDVCPLGEPQVMVPAGMGLSSGGLVKTAGDGFCSWEAGYEGSSIDLDRDLVVTIPFGRGRSRLSVLAYRDVETERLDTSAAGGPKYQDDSGYFLAEAFFNETAGPEPLEAEKRSARGPGRDVVVLFDTSLSMQFEKLEKAAQVFASVLDGLTAGDNFTVATMGREVTFWKKNPAPATASSKNSAMDFLRDTPLTGGTPLKQGLVLALAAFGGRDSGRRRQVIAITDGQPTLDTIKHAAVREAVREKNQDGQGAEIGALYIFGIGDGVNGPLLTDLARDSGGYYIWARETEDLGDKLKAFNAALSGVPVRGVAPSFDPALGAEMVYPSVPLAAFNQESLSWVGRYRTPMPQSVVKVTGQRAGNAVTLAETAAFPEHKVENDFVARLWAERRVEALLGRIRDEGGREEWVDEIVALSKRYKFPTPYTSYLVAPRAFLRPRVIRPFDPILTVKADAGTRSIIALFPFGLAVPMRYVASAQVWEARFLVPGWMKDGRYFCRLVLTDEAGTKRMEYKEFIVDSAPPRLKIRLGAVRPGQGLDLFVDADPDTRRITASLAALPAVSVKWDREAGVNRGRILIPPSFPPGQYVINITAEDFAHNITSAQSAVRIGG